MHLSRRLSTLFPQHVQNVLVCLHTQSPNIPIDIILTSIRDPVNPFVSENLLIGSCFGLDLIVDEIEVCCVMVVRLWRGRRPVQMSVALWQRALSGF